MENFSVDMESMIAEAEAKGKALVELEKKNKKRRAKGRPPLPDPSDKADLEVSKTRYRTQDYTAVDGADAMRLFEMRKRKMEDESDLEDGEPYDLDDDEKVKAAVPDMNAAVKDIAKAVREAEAVRRVQDMKNGRIDHEGNWSKEGQKLEGGDSTVIVDKSEIKKIWGAPQQSKEGNPEDENQKNSKKTKKAAKIPDNEATLGGMNELYSRLGASFTALEQSISDLQGRVSEIVIATTPPPPTSSPDKSSEFEALLAKKTPVAFDVNGTTLSFDAITVFHAPPCITVVSKIGSAKITPKPGARILLSYTMDGKVYRQDPVTYLGTRFDLPMFGLSFVGFIRDLEADVLDAGDAPQPQPHLQPTVEQTTFPAGMEATVHSDPVED